MLDTETAGGLDNPQVYDLGLMVIDRKGNAYESYSLVIKETFFNLDLMKTAYYMEKLPNYFKELLEEKRELVTMLEAYYLVKEICETYDIKAIIAHNALFDYKALNNTLRLLTNKNYFYPKGVEIWDTMKMALSVVATKKHYIKYCKENNFMTKHKKPRPRVTAEVLYKYITNNLEFVESHTGLEDCKIEKEIFVYCLNKKQKMTKKLFND